MGRDRGRAAAMDPDRGPGTDRRPGLLAGPVATARPRTGVPAEGQLEDTAPGHRVGRRDRGHGDRRPIPGLAPRKRDSIAPRAAPRGKPAPLSRGRPGDVHVLRNHGGIGPSPVPKVNDRRQAGVRPTHAKATHAKAAHAKAVRATLAIASGDRDRGRGRAAIVDPATGRALRRVSTTVRATTVRATTVRATTVRAKTGRALRRVSTTVLGPARGRNRRFGRDGSRDRAPDLVPSERASALARETMRPCSH
jgi:hypothetical protein